MVLRVGDLKRGVDAALNVPGRMIKRDCGAILEQIKQFDQAGKLYEAGAFADRAAAAYMRAKNWTKVDSIIEQVRSPKILQQYGKVLTGEKKFEKALGVYQRAKDYSSQIEILLKHLDRIDDAVRLAQESRSVDGAKMIARYFTDAGNNESAIEFLVLSQCFQEAFDLADGNHLMRVYADSIESVGSQEQFIKLSEYFHSNGQLLMAGKFAGLAKNFPIATAMKLTIQAVEYLLTASEKRQVGSEDEDELAKYAIDFVAESKDQQLTYRLIEFLLGENDGVPKNPKFLFQFYIRLKMYAEAAKIAIIIAQEQQSKGSYRTAHDLLFSMYKTLREEKIHIPNDVANGLQLLHSYSIIKGLLRRGENYTAAKLLIRVAQNISLFPQHAVQILTSTVVTCSKAGLHKSAFQYASQLLQPGYRQKIDEKYRRKIETVVRKSQRDAEVEDELLPCPFCDGDTPLAAFTLVCSNCKSTIPYCIATGRHLVRADFTYCQSCLFPAYYSEFSKLARAGESCPMCHQPISDISPQDFSEYMEMVGQKLPGI